MQLMKQEAIRLSCIQMRRALISLLKALDDFLGYTEPDRPYANDNQLFNYSSLLIARDSL